MGQAERTQAVAAEFDRSWSSLLGSAGWWPDRLQAECSRIAREEGGVAAALRSRSYVDTLCSSLVKWKAFRGVRMDRERVDAALSAVAPLLPQWEGVSLLTLRRGRLPGLFELFDAMRDIKPTVRKWVVTSKTLHHLLPDLIVPMDNLMTAPFLGRSALPATLEREFLAAAYAAFSDLAAAIGKARVRAAAREVPFPVAGFAPKDCRIGPARVVDFAIAGLVLEHGGPELRRR